MCNCRIFVFIQQILCTPSVRGKFCVETTLGQHFVYFYYEILTPEKLVLMKPHLSHFIGLTSCVKKFTH